MKFGLKAKKTAPKEASTSPRKLSPGTAKSSKSLSFIALYKKIFLQQAHFVLLIGDEGSILLYMKGSTLVSRQFVSDASDGNLDELRETITKDRQAPITMIIDSVDQSFVQQTLPPVSSLSVAKLIKRRLDRDFKPDDIKGAITLGRDKDGRKDWNFLMVSVEKSPQLIIWLNFIMTFDNRFKGIVLLSAEAALVVRNIERALGASPKTGTGSEWKILVSHNKVGGFRQIILRNGRLIFTRLALPVGEPAPAVIAGNIEQEMLNTIEYLKRFGYNAKSGLDVYIIVGEDVCPLIDSTRFDAQNFYAFSPHSVAGYLGIKQATKPADQFGDVVLAAAIGANTRNILKLTTVESRLFDKYQLFKYGQRLAATFLLLGLVIQVAVIGLGALRVRSDAEDAAQKQRLNQMALESLKKQVSDSNINVDMVGNQIDLFKQAKSETRNPLPFFALLSQAVKFPVAIKSVRWEIGDTLDKNAAVPSLTSFNLLQEGEVPGSPPAMPGAGAVRRVPGMPPMPMAAAPADAAGAELMTAVLVLEFPAGLKSPALFKKFCEEFLKEMHAVLPDYTLVYTAVPGEYLDQKSLQMDFDQTPSENTLGKTPVEVEVRVRGPIPAEGGAKP